MALPRALTGAFLLSLVLAAPAAAQVPIPTPPPAETPAPPPAPTPTPTPPPAPAPAAGTLAVKAVTGFKDGKQQLALRGKRFKVSGTLAPFVAGQKVQLRVMRGKRTLAKRTVAVKQAGANGKYSARFTLNKTGGVKIRAVHAATPELALTRSPVARVSVLRPSVGPGDSGPSVRALQRGLNRLKYAAGTSGRYDDATGRAILAWRKVNSKSRVYTADSAQYAAVLRGKGGWKVRHPESGKHVEAILSKQAFALIKGDKVVRVIPTSSGAPATPTILGHYRFYRKDLGTNALGMVDAAYFIRGYAIHGYHDVPTYNASHGCLRISNATARYVYNWVDLGDDIFVSAS